VTYAAPGAPPAAWVEPPVVRDNPVAALRRLANRIGTLCWVELRKIRHDRTELYTRAIQPALWLLIYGEVIQGVAVVIIAAILGVSFTTNPLKLIGAAIVLVLGSAFFSCLSMSIAGVALARDRLMGIGQAITMPLFFSSSALYPTWVMPGWLQAISKVNPLTYEVEALRGLLIGIPTTLWLDTLVLAGSTLASITCASLLLPRLANR